MLDATGITKHATPTGRVDAWTIRVGGESRSLEEDDDGAMEPAGAPLPLWEVGIVVSVGNGRDVRLRGVSKRGRALMRIRADLAAAAQQRDDGSVAICILRTAQKDRLRNDVVREQPWREIWA